MVIKWVKTVLFLEAILRGMSVHRACAGRLFDSNALAQHYTKQPRAILLDVYPYLYALDTRGGMGMEPLSYLSTLGKSGRQSLPPPPL